jgi:hypothetical protein
MGHIWRGRIDLRSQLLELGLRCAMGRLRAAGLATNVNVPAAVRCGLKGRLGMIAPGAEVPEGVFSHLRSPSGDAAWRILSFAQSIVLHCGCGAKSGCGATGADGFEYARRKPPDQRSSALMKSAVAASRFGAQGTGAGFIAAMVSLSNHRRQ